VGCTAPMLVRGSIPCRGGGPPSIRTRARGPSLWVTPEGGVVSIDASAAQAGSNPDGAHHRAWERLASLVVGSWIRVSSSWKALSGGPALGL
jgi:hypothetical protein